MIATNLIELKARLQIKKQLTRSCFSSYSIYNL